MKRMLVASFALLFAFSGLFAAGAPVGTARFPSLLGAALHAPSNRNLSPVNGLLLNFQESLYASNAYEPTAMAVADFNGDGIPDVAMTNWCASETTCQQSSLISVFLGNGDGTFQPSTTYAAGGEPNWIAAADFNGDGKQDLVFINHCQPGNGCEDGVTDFGVLFGNGDGTFQPAVYNYVLNEIGTGAVGDLNGDGLPDLAFTTGGSIDNETFYVLLNQGQGTFGQPIPETAQLNPGGIAMGDFNRDGNLDIAVSNYCGTVGDCFDARHALPGSAYTHEQSCDGSVSVLFGNGDGTFQPTQNLCTGGNPGTTFAVDLNGDGIPDIVTPVVPLLFSYESMQVLISNGDGTFQSPVTYPIYGSIIAGFADFNGDGLTDVMLLGPGLDFVNVILGAGGGNLSGSLLAFPTQGVPGGGATGLFNGQGQGSSDIVIGDGDTDMGALLNEAATRISFGSKPNPSVQGRPVTFAAKVVPGVSGTGHALTGNVTFESDGKKYKAPLGSNGVAKFTTSKIPAGSYSVTATYSGNVHFNPNQSQPIIQVVQQ